jgi:CheY-like chemotaxis protein/TolB-like protein/Tfp pilus assembly protein PilF
MSHHSPTPAPSGAVSPVLLVDDDATNLDVLRQTLSGPSYLLFVARNGEDAVKVARRVRPQVILLDIVMSGMDGYETCRRLKDDPDTRDAAVIFLSALTDAKDKVRGFEAGAVDFITKPFEGEEVIARVNTHLAIQRVLRRQAEARSPGPPQDRDGDAPTGGHAVGREGLSESVFQTGDVVAFRFRIVRYLARGGMGELYEAEDLELRERVALKTILSTIGDNERSILLFKREVHLARQVTHPNVCRIYDVFRHRVAGADGGAQEVVFLAMELLHGETLADKLAREGRMPPAEILPIARQMAAGLAAAHRVGVVHRDFKTHNVMLVKPDSSEEEMRVVVTDFGVARRTAQHDTTGFSLSVGDMGEFSGTPAYMAPEQVEGDTVTPATDVYAFGVVLYELVTGVRPFVADTPVRTAIKRLHEPPTPPRVHVPDVNPRWEATILRCLARQPADRFASVGDVVASLDETGGEAVANSPRRRWAIGVGLMLALIVLAALAGGYARYVAGRAAAGITSIAVLPFDNASKDEEQEFLSDGISEALITRLSQLQGVKVVANSSSSQFKGSSDPQQVARALDVAAVLTGRVSQRGDNLTVSVELINGTDRTRLWGEQYVRKASYLIQMPAEISRDVAEKLRVRLTAGDQRRMATTAIGNAKAYELVLRGHFHRAKGGTEDRQKAGEYFREAIEADPKYALAYADLSDIYRSLLNSGQLAPAEYLPKARAAAQTSLELDDTLADGHYALANMMTYGWEWSAAERQYQRAIELNPNLALAHRWYAAYLRLMGRHDEAITEILRARELDPLSPGVNATVGFVLSSAGRYQEASEALRKTLELDRTYPYAHLYLGHVHMAQKQYAEAIAAYRQAATLGLDTPATRISLGTAYARAGQNDRARTILEELRASPEHVSPGERAILLAALGEREEAFTSLEEAYRAHDGHLQHLGVDPGYDSLRADPRFQDLLRRVGLAR